MARYGASADFDNFAFFRRIEDDMIQRRTPLPRQTVPIKRTAIVRRARRPKPGDDMDYRAFLREQCKCCVCSKLPVADRPILWWLIDPAHTIHDGMALKGADRTCIPLCRFHHDEMDGRLSTAIVTKAEFAAKYDIDLAREADVHYAAFLIWKENEE